MAAVPLPITARSQCFINKAVLPATGLLRLYGRALDRSEGAEHTAVARLGAQPRAAARALVKKLARVRGHALGLAEGAIRAGQDRIENRRVHFFGVDG